MTRPVPDQPKPPEQQGHDSEVVISGLDTGPSGAERHNLSPTEELAQFVPADHPRDEPEDEDG